MKSCKVDGAGGGGVTWFDASVEDRLAAFAEAAAKGSVACAVRGAPAATEVAAKGSVVVAAGGAPVMPTVLTVPARGSPVVGFVPPGASGGAITITRQMWCKAVSTGFGVQWVKRQFR